MIITITKKKVEKNPISVSGVNVRSKGKFKVYDTGSGTWIPQRSSDAPSGNDERQMRESHQSNWFLFVS